MELYEIREKIKKLEGLLEQGPETGEDHDAIKRQIEQLRVFELQARAKLDKIKAKPGEIVYLDPVTLKPHPLSAALYREDQEMPEWRTSGISQLQALQIVIESMDITDILESIKRNGIRTPLIINENRIIISGCRRWKAALQLGLTSVPCEVRSFENEDEETKAILDFNLYRNKTFSQRMKEAELLIEIESKRAKKRMLSGRRDPSLILGEGYYNKRHSRETYAIVGDQIGMGKDTFKKAMYILDKAKMGDRKARKLVRSLDRGGTSIHATYITLKKLESGDRQEWGKQQCLEPSETDDSCPCPYCHKRFPCIKVKGTGSQSIDI